MKQNILLVEGISHNKPALFFANVRRTGSFFPCLNTELSSFLEQTSNTSLGVFSNQQDAEVNCSQLFHLRSTTLLHAFS